MATVLAAQLAQIRKRSTNPLDLKAQKKAHSQSLLFNPSVAAIQDFDNLYQICVEGYGDLCRLDPKFARFTGNIFSEQSKQEDRTQMTAAQNEQLDDVLEGFLCLVGSRLLLKPALKAVEWLIRRFRIHEYNTQSLLFTFLPYHANAVFLSVLSILPQSIPPIFKFLHPYVQSTANPPRHTIVHTASNNRPFFAALSFHLIKTHRLGYQQPSLTSIWVEIATQAVAAMLDQANFSRRQSQKENQDGVIVFLLPIINEALSIENVPDLTIACYTVLTILASKVHLDDRVVTTMMEAVTSRWSQTSHAGLICLSALAQLRKTPILPKRVFKAVIALDKIDNDLVILNQVYRVDQLALGVILGVLNGLEKSYSTSRLGLIRNIMETGLMDEEHCTVAIRNILSTTRNIESDPNSTLYVHGLLADLLLRLADCSSVGTLVRGIGKAFELDEGGLLQRVMFAEESSPAPMIEDEEPKDSGGQAVTDDFDTLTNRIPTRTAYETSFLSHSESFVFGSLANAFALLSFSDGNIHKFSELPVLRKSLVMSEPLFISFFIRVWCGNGSANSRAAAVRAVSKCIGKVVLAADVQLLLPYLIYGLADPLQKVRKEVINLILILARGYAEAIKVSKGVSLPILGREQIYGPGEERTHVAWLSIDDSYRFIADVLVPGLEECLVDHRHISWLLLNRLGGSKQHKALEPTQKSLKRSLRLSIYECLCTHVISTPLYRVKSRLLNVLNQINKVGDTSREKLLLPMLSQFANQSQDELERICTREELDSAQFLDQVAGIVIPDDRDKGIQVLKDKIEPLSLSACPSFRSAALRRIRAIWQSVKPDIQMDLANALLEQSLVETETEEDKTQSSEAIATLRALPLPLTILQSLIDGLLSISSTTRDNVPASKRRRTSHGYSTEADADSIDSARAVNRINFVLELVSDAKAERHPELLKGLFQVMSLLQNSRTFLQAAPEYLLVLTIDSILAIVKRVERLSDLAIDHSAIRTDAVVDCIRTTTSPQVRNEALLLVAALAIVTPKTVLHSVMPIFTFMGSKVLRQDDEYSVFVVKRTMESVIPRLVQSLHEGKESPFVGVCELLLSFAGAFEHIPTERRLDLFKSLVDKVGPHDYLFALAVILMDKYPDEKRTLQFAADLTSRYNGSVRLRMVERYLEVILDARKPKPILSAPLLMITENRNIEDVIANLLQLPSIVLSDQSLVSEIGRALSQEGEDAASIRSSYAHTLEEIFLLFEQSKNDRREESLCMRILDALLRLLPIPELVNTLQDLLLRTEDHIRRQILRSFGQRLDHTTSDKDASRMACLAFLPHLLTLLGESEDIMLKQILVGCVDKVTEKFGKKANAAVRNAAHVIASEDCLGAIDINLRVASLLCLATTVEIIGENFVSVAPDAFPKALHYLSVSIQEDTDNADLHDAVYTFLNALLHYLPWVVTGANLDRFLEVSYESANAGMGAECDQKRIEVLQLVAKQVAAKDCFEAIKRTWAHSMAEGPLAVKECLDILRVAIDRHPKASIVKLSHILGDLFLKMFDLRRIQLSPPTEDSYTTDEIEQVEDTLVKSAIAMIYKLNDAAFRPLFSRFLDWTASADLKNDGKAKIQRQTTWYTFLLEFFGTLKSIVTNYAGFMIDDSVEILNKASFKDEDSRFLWRQVVCTLHKTFEHDQDDFYQSPSHFTPVSNGLLSQLAKAAEIPLLPELIPAIAELAVATDSATHHKEMNTAILQYMRSENSAVRLASVQCERALTERLGEEWLALLPEMLPFIGEALEDDDEAVESEVQKWVAAIEGILGESLTPMLQ